MIYDELHERMAEDDGMLVTAPVITANYTGREKRKDHEARMLYNSLTAISKYLGVNPEDIASYLMMPDVRTFYIKIITDFRHESEEKKESFGSYASGQMQYINREMIEIGNAAGEGFGHYC